MMADITSTTDMAIWPRVSNRPLSHLRRDEYRTIPDPPLSEGAAPNREARHAGKRPNKSNAATVVAAATSRI